MYYLGKNGRICLNCNPQVADGRTLLLVWEDAEAAVSSVMNDRDYVTLPFLGLTIGDLVANHIEFVLLVKDDPYACVPIGEIIQRLTREPE
jgi:hypothetical protein